MQSRLDSFLESLTNVLVGFVVAWVTWRVLAWAMGLPISAGQGILIVTVFTVISIIRSYVIRRLLNGVPIWQAIKGLFR